MHFPKDMTAHTTTFDGPIVDHWLEREKARAANASTMQDRSATQEDPNLCNFVFYCLSYSPLPTSLWNHNYHSLSHWLDPTNGFESNDLPKRFCLLLCYAACIYVTFSIFNVLRLWLLLCVRVRATNAVALQ